MDNYTELLVALGFGEVATVIKRREVAHLTWEGIQVEVALDQVSQAGQFVELEICAGDDDLQLAKNALKSLASTLDLHEIECRSYLELLVYERT